MPVRRGGAGTAVEEGGFVRFKERGRWGGGYEGDLRRWVGDEMILWLACG